MKKWMWLAALMVFLTIFASAAFAADDRPIRAKAYAEKDFMEKFYHPMEGVTLGADFRARYIYAPHISTLSDSPPNRQSNWHFSRFRTRLWGKWELHEDVDFNARAVNEWRIWCDPASKPAHWNGDEIFFDRFNLTWRNAFDMPLTMVFGRQDIALGHRWLIFEGTQNDGSRTIYFDAIRATYSWSDTFTTDAIYINNVAYQRNRIKPINDRLLPVNYEDTQAFILYNSKKWSNGMKTDGYWIWRKDDEVITPVSEDSDFHTLGGLIDGRFGENDQYEYYAELAGQYGAKDGKTLQALGFNSKFMYHSNDEWKNCYGLSYEFMSGDNPSTTTNEQFDPLWGVWPQWSELYIYTYSQETTIAEVTNLHRLGLHWTFQPRERLTVAAAYHLLWSDENSFKDKTTSQIDFSDSGDFRGQLASLWFIYNHNEHWKGHLVTEYFYPGTYYDDSNRDAAFWLRLNVEYTF